MAIVLVLINLLFLLVFLIFTLQTFWPGWRTNTWGTNFTLAALIRWLIGTIVIVIVWLIVSYVVALLLGVAFAPPLLGRP